MACYKPLKGFNLGLKDNGKKDICVTSYQVDHVEVDKQGHVYKVLDRSGTPGRRMYRDFDTIPCGRCIGCRLQKSKNWADRAVLELQYHDSNLFLTLTYDEDHVPESYLGDTETGEITCTNFTLDKKDLQDFWKRLRDHYGKLRYLACGEYGSLTKRPHYHAIVFGLKVDDLVFYKRNELGDILWTSETLNKIWKKGFVIIGEATWQSIAYVARYVTKKKYGDEAEIYEKLNITPEFLVMSRKPGIARQYYEDHKEKLFEEGRYPIPLRDSVGTAFPSRYFNNLFELDFDSGQFELRKDKMKKMFDDQNKLKLEYTDLDYLDYLGVEEYNKEEAIKGLPRIEI